jgi:hypothetical protein
MGMSKHADTAIVAAEQRKKNQRRIFPHVLHRLFFGAAKIEKIREMQHFGTYCILM